MQARSKQAVEGVHSVLTFEGAGGSEQLLWLLLFVTLKRKSRKAAALRVSPPWGKRWKLIRQHC